MAERYMMEIRGLGEHFEQVCFDCGSSVVSADGLSSSEALSLSLRSDLAGGRRHLDDDDDDDDEEEDVSSSAEGSSSRWSSANIISKCIHKPLPFAVSVPLPKLASHELRKKPELSELEMMKEKFSKLLLGEDMSGGGKGVCSALAISNAITNLSASVFGELWRLEPLSTEKKTMWRREMDWLLSVADHIVEFVPSRQTLRDGSQIEVMVTRPRSDIHVNLPALKKLDGMLLEAMDEFSSTEFWYADQGVFVPNEDGGRGRQRHRQDGKWWLPVPKMPLEGLSKNALKQLRHQRECVNQIHKAAIAINTQILSEMETPEIYFTALPKNVKTSLGDAIYKHLSSESFYPDAILDTLDLCSEHKAVDTANRIEAAIHILQRRRRRSKPVRDSKHTSKSSWGLMKDFMVDMDRREFMAGRAESLLLCLKQRFPNLRQTLLDITKIQHNRDVGQALLESYSRVLESLAFNISARIEDVLCASDMARQAMPPATSSPYPGPRMVMIPSSQQQRHGCSSFSHSLQTPHGTPLATPSASPTPSSSPRRTLNSPLHSGEESPDYLAYAYEYESVGIVRVPAIGTASKIQASSTPMCRTEAD